MMLNNWLFIWEENVTLSYAIYRGTWGVLHRKGGERVQLQQGRWFGELRGDASRWNLSLLVEHSYLQQGLPIRNPAALVTSGRYNKYTIDWVAYTINSYFSQFWRLWSSRSRCQHIQCLVRAFFLAGWWPLSWILTWRRERERKEALAVSSYKGTNPIMRAPSSWSDYLPRPHLQIHWGLGFHKWTWGEHEHLFHSTS